MSDAIYNLMCVAIGFLCGAIVWRGDLLEAKTNARMLDRYQRAVSQLNIWCGHESPHARLIAAHISAIGEGNVPINAGTPCRDEVCDIDGTRQQLRMLDAERVRGLRQEIDGLEALMADTEWLKAELAVRMEREEQRSTDPRPAMPALQSVGVAAELAVARQAVRAEQAG